MVHSIDTAIGIERVMTRLYDPRHTFVIHVDGYESAFIFNHYFLIVRLMIGINIFLRKIIEAPILGL
jgi:hypothetical protein